MSEVKSFKLVSSVLIDRILKDQCVSTAQLDQLSKASSPDLLHFVCTAFPGPASEWVFVELETPDGKGSGLGEWITRPDGLVALVVPASRDFDAQRLRADTAEAEALGQYAKRVAAVEELADAEQSIAELSANNQQLRKLLEQTLAALNPTKALSKSIRAALNPNPNPEVESHQVAREALKMENQRITPARFKCLACGEYHEGSGNLPCPKMLPSSITLTTESYKKRED